MRFFHLKFDDAKMTKSQYRSYLRREGGVRGHFGFFQFSGTEFYALSNGVNDKAQNLAVSSQIAVVRGGG